MRLPLIGLILCISLPVSAQQENAGFGINVSGFVKTDIFHDTRQTVSIREGHFLLYPAAEQPDQNNKDINAKASFNILSIQTRLTGKISAPDAFGAKTSGQIEAEFFGTSDNDINLFRLRHAFLKLDWLNTSLLVGQAWHPMFITEMFPGVVSFNTGVPFQPFSRNPQVRVTHAVANFKFIAAALSQRDFQSNGPGGYTTVYLRNSIIPNLHAQVQFSHKGNLAGAGLDYKRIIPRIATSKNYKTNTAVSGLSATGFFKLNFNPVSIKAQGTYGQNLVDLLQIGGYAVQSVDTVTGIESYTVLSSASLWADLSIGKQIEYGLFLGYTKALGAADHITGSYYGRATDIDNIFRISPRVQLNSNKTRIAVEIEYTSAGYGTPNGLNKGKIEDVKNMVNIRTLLAFFYFF